MVWVVSATPWERDPVPVIQESGWTPGLVWTGVEIFPPPGFDPWTIYIQKLSKIVLIIPIFESVHSVFHNWGDHEYKDISVIVLFTEKHKFI